MWKISRSVSEKVSRRLFASRRKCEEPPPEDGAASSPSVQIVASSSSRNYVEESEEHQSLSMLYSLARRWAWPAVAFRCQTHPQEADATFRDHKGDTAMHWACFGNPPSDVIAAMLEACPQLASTPNDTGVLPLHGEYGRFEIDQERGVAPYSIAVLLIPLLHYHCSRLFL